MNTENLLKLAKHLESITKDDFDMDQWTFNCGSPACIAGYAAYLSLNHPVNLWNAVEYLSKLCEIAKDWLELSELDSEKLFTPFNIPKFEELNIDLKDPKAAAKVVRHFAKTGYVDWSKADEEPATAGD